MTWQRVSRVWAAAVLAVVVGLVIWMYTSGNRDGHLPRYHPASAIALLSQAVLVAALPGRKTVVIVGRFVCGVMALTAALLWASA